MTDDERKKAAAAMAEFNGEIRDLVDMVIHQRTLAAIGSSLTTRQAIAALAMQGLIIKSEDAMNSLSNRATAEEAVRFADALLSVLKEKP